MSSITASFPNGLQSQFGPENKNSSGNAIGPSVNSPNRAASSSLGSATDNTDLSQFAELMSGLRLVQQTDPGAYKELLSAIGARISNAAEDASSAGSAAVAGLIAELEADLSDASAGLQPPPATEPSTAHVVDLPHGKE
jgi:hypothetical protein